MLNKYGVTLCNQKYGPFSIQSHQCSIYVHMQKKKSQDIYTKEKGMLEKVGMTLITYLHYVIIPLCLLQL
jgi:hypothetical protein